MWYLVLVVFNTSINRQFEEVSSMLKTLYLATFDVGYMHILRVIYAADEDEAQQKKGDLEREINAPCKNL